MPSARPSPVKALLGLNTPTHTCNVLSRFHICELQCSIFASTYTMVQGRSLILSNCKVCEISCEAKADGKSILLAKKRIGVLFCAIPKAKDMFKHSPKLDNPNICHKCLIASTYLREIITFSAHLRQHTFVLCRRCQ